ncbi:MAG TPA: hypothetical protein PK109_00150 [Candidatus Paceibacterota bacterium]|nr:hypothetical protein [Candidatus Paceibacterota bacterium]
MKNPYFWWVVLVTLGFAVVYSLPIGGTGGIVILHLLWKMVAPFIMVAGVLTLLYMIFTGSPKK